MTIATTTNRVQTQANGILTAFSFTFKTFSQSDLEVYTVVRATGEETLKTLTTHYTVALNASSPGGTVTFLVAPAGTLDVLIVRKVALTQPTDIPNRGSVREEQIENVYDRLVMIDQQQQEQIERTIQVPIASLIDGTLPAPEAGMCIGWNDAEDGFENISPAEQGETGETGPTGPQGPAGIDGGNVQVTLTDGATVALNAALGNEFVLAANGNRTILAPSNPSAGKRIIIRHTAVGADRTLSFTTGAGGFRFGTTITSSTATLSGKTDRWGAFYHDVDDRWDLAALAKGF